MVKGSHQVWCRGLSEEARALLKPTDAAARLTTGGFVDIDCEPKFRIAPEAKIFAIGSCFALNLSRALVSSGFPVLSWKFEHHERGLPLMAKFNTYSMLTELEVAVGGRTLPDDGLVELSEGQWWDPQLHHAEPGPREHASALRKHVNAYFRRILDADVCVFTLGLTEMFWDLVTDIPLNASPIDWRHAQRTGRFEFRNPGFEAVAANVKASCDLVHRVTGGRAKVVLTVSPVPLQRTFSDNDIIVANSYSKCLLRAVAQRVRDTHDFVEYFPAYEFVVNSPREIAWEHDQQHVRPDMVAHVIASFRRQFAPAEA